MASPLLPKRANASTVWAHEDKSAQSLTTTSAKGTEREIMVLQKQNQEKQSQAKEKNDIIKEKHSSTYYFEKLYKMDSRF